MDSFDLKINGRALGAALRHSIVWGIGELGWQAQTVAQDVPK